MRFILVTGPMFTVYCAGCNRCLKAGDVQVRTIECDRVYLDVATNLCYCEACAVRHKRTEVRRADIRELALSAREVCRL